MIEQSRDGKGRYDFVENLGKGRSGQTYLARVFLPNGSAKRVVIKQIYYPQEPLDALIQRFRTVGKHPQLPALVDGWQTPDGQFFAFDYIAYPPLTQTEPPPWSPEQVKPWLLSLLKVLEHLHSFRLVHGDIRPANIRQESLHRPPVLVDLRIAPRLPKEKMALATGGDAAYGAPEQALGQQVYASDLYSLGLVAIHLLTGLPPFDLYSVADRRWIWPDLVVEPLPPNLDTVLHRLLEHSLDERYTRAAQAISDLTKTPVLSLLDKARTFLPAQASLSIPLQVLAKPKPASPALPAPAVPPIHWQPLYQFTTNSITTALALQENQLAMGTNMGQVFVGNLATDQEMYTLDGAGHRDRITAIAWHPQRALIYSASWDGTVKLWDMASGQLVHTLSQPGWQPTDLAIAPPYLAVSDGTGHITLWDLDSLTQRHSFNQHQDWISAIAASGQRLVSISRDRTLRLWSLAERCLLETIPIGQREALALHPSGDHVIIGNAQGEVDVWHRENPTTPDRLCTLEDGITAMALSPDARLLAVGTDGNVLRMYLGTSGQCVS